jgi:GntR family transcriptional repressor for pyruvate dehydrogenase complex
MELEVVLAGLAAERRSE